MAEMVLDKARRIVGESRRLAEGAAEIQQAARINRRVMGLREGLRMLSNHVTVARAVNEAAGASLVDLSGLDSGLADFKKKVASTPNPSDQAFNTARARVDALCKRLHEQTLGVWTRWATARIQDVPLNRFPMLEFEHQRLARSKKAELDRVTTKSDLSVSDIRVFKLTLETLDDMLTAAPDVPGDLVAVLDRLSRTPSPTLAEVSDEEIQLLRSAHLDSQIVIKRIGG
jgi:hypothetical protein